jgi:hypothetical protein
MIIGGLYGLRGIAIIWPPPGRTPATSGAINGRLWGVLSGRRHMVDCHMVTTKEATRRPTSSVGSESLLQSLVTRIKRLVVRTCWDDGGMTDPRVSLVEDEFKRIAQADRQYASVAELNAEDWPACPECGTQANQYGRPDYGRPDVARVFHQLQVGRSLRSCRRRARA